MRIAYQGEPGAYSEAAGLKFHASADVMPCPSFEDVFAADLTARECAQIWLARHAAGALQRPSRALA